MRIRGLTVEWAAGAASAVAGSEIRPSDPALATIMTIILLAMCMTFPSSELLRFLREAGSRPGRRRASPRFGCCPLAPAGALEARPGPAPPGGIRPVPHLRAPRPLF